MLTHNVEFKTFFDFESSIFHIFHFVATMKEVGYHYGGSFPGLAPVAETGGACTLL